MRIVLCNWKDLAHPAAGGAEVYVHEVARRWAAQGHRVTLIAAGVRGRPAREHVDGVRVVRVGGRLSVYREARRHFDRELRGHVDLLVDVVNTRPFGCPTWGAGAPVVALVFQVAREVWLYETPPPIGLVGRHWLEPRWLSGYRSVPVLTISASSRESLREYGLEKITVVPVGCDVVPRSGGVVKDKKPTVIFVGRLAANKRPDDALAAHARLRERIPSNLWLVGTGPLEAPLRRQASPDVTVFGRIERAWRQELMSRAHALVVTSVREGWGLVVDEAAAAGTPTVGYDVPGLRDSIAAAGGTLVAPDPAALADELTRVLPDLVREPPTAGWTGGARSWDEVAATVLDEALAAVCRSPIGAAR